MTYRQIREDEEASWVGAVKVGHASNRCASEDGKAGVGGSDATLSNGASVLERREKEEISIVGEGDVVLGVLAFEDLQLDNWWWIDWATIGRCWTSQLRWPESVWTIDIHLAPEPHALARIGCWMTVRE